MIELSADLGEGAPREDEIWALVDAANVACGGHTGDERSMEYSVTMAAERGVVLGAHPSYPDREHFGRRSIRMELRQLEDSVAEQLSALAAVAARGGIALRRVKPHGALYNDAHRDRALADVVVRAMRRIDRSLALVASSSSQMAAAAAAAGMPVVREAFADRRYQADGSLTPRSERGSLLSVDEAAAQARLLVAEGVAIASDGSRVAIAFDTLCIHADMEGAVERLLAIGTAVGRG